MLHRFRTKFYALSSSAKKFESRLRFDKVTESLEVGTFSRHSVVLIHPHRGLNRTRPDVSQNSRRRNLGG